MLSNIDKEIKANILIVDDNANNILAMKVLLEKFPIIIHEAHSGNEALKKLTEHEFSLVLLDVQMPDMDGFELAELMRKHKRTKEIPIIFVTAINKEEQYIKKGLQIGAVDYLFKPFDPIIFISKISVFINYYIQQKQLQNLINQLNTSQEALSKKNQTLNRLIHVDPVTGIGNRLNFEEALDRTTQYVKRYKKICAVMILDLDNFKYVNDNFGHDTGDLLLKTVAENIKNNIRHYDIVGRSGVSWSISRLGGDEFAILLPEIDNLAVAGEVAKRIIELFSKPLNIQNNEIRISASIGISCFPDSGKTPEELIKNADIAMYRAKIGGKNQFQYFSESLHKDYQRQAQLEISIKQALDRNEFYLMYQPIIDLKRENIVGVEALCRWHNPLLGEVLSHEFISIAEETGVIRPLGQWVMNTAIEDMQFIEETLQQSLHCHVNVSPRQLLDNEFIDFVQSKLNNNLFLPANFTLELTETALMENVKALEAGLERLTNIGFKISADDFGTGYSSLHRLITLPITSLKIDQSFVQALTDHPNDTTIIKSILGLAKNLNLTTIGEGIETKEQLQFLQKYACQFGQGFYFAKPMTRDELIQYLNEVKVVR